MNKRQIIACISLAVASLPATAQQNKNEVNLVAGAAMMDMGPGDYGAATNVQYTRWFHPWFGAEARLGLVRYNDFPSFSNYTQRGQPWKVANEFDTYILNMEASKAYFAEWNSTTFFAGELSAIVSPLHTARHHLKLFGGVTRQYRATSMMYIVEWFEAEDETIESYTPGYTLLNLAEWGRHYGIAYQYRLTNDWLVGATVKLTKIDIKASVGHSDHALFGLSVGKAF